MRAASRRGALLLAATLAAGTSVAGVAFGAGGLSTPANPQIDDVECLTLCVKQRIATEGSRIRIKGTDLYETTVVSFSGAANRRAKQTAKDGVVAKPNGLAVLATVPDGAVTGPIRLANRAGDSVESGFDLKIGTPEQLKKALAGFKFPIRGPHDYGGSMSRFGAKRSGHTHQGQDVSASCGTKLVAARAGKVQYAGYQGSGAGNYVVIDGRKWNDYVYMHLKKPASVRKGQTVYTGQQVGKVGTTGSSSGCHLHFEIWSEPGWYSGGHPIDPLKTLRSWDSFS